MAKYPVNKGGPGVDKDRIISGEKKNKTELVNTKSLTQVIRETIECIDTDSSGTIEISELLVAFRSEIGGGAHGIVRAVAKFGRCLLMTACARKCMSKSVFEPSNTFTVQNQLGQTEYLITYSTLYRLKFNR